MEKLDFGRAWQSAAGTASPASRHIIQQPMPASPYGPTSSCLFGDLTDEAFVGDLSELGWKGSFKCAAADGRAAVRPLQPSAVP